MIAEESIIEITAVLRCRRSLPKGERTAPWGGVPHTGHLRLNGLPDDGFIADAIAEVTEDLRAGQAACRHVTAGQP